jgi:DNA-binding SARP family transcriptional activator/tetratricopeptide (TPR) repeat protein
MELRLLGPVRMWCGGEEVPLGRPRQRCVLAVLAMTPGEPVGVDQLVARVWGETMPGDPRNVLYTHISRLRRTLATADPERGSVLRRGNGGYLLDVADDVVDLHRARRLAARARELGGHGWDGDLRAVDLADEAGRLWHGTPLAGLSGSWVERTREALGHERMALLSDGYAARLRLGQHASVVGPLSDLLADNPMAEPVAGMLMLALYRCGRQDEALGVYARLRRRLVEALGDEPGVQLRQLHEQVLRRDPGLDRPAPTHAAPPDGGDTPVALPAQLPADVPGFAGRGADLARLDLLLASEDPDAVVISAIDGAAGVGKTALAVRWAHRVRDRFPDGQLYANLRGYAPGAVPVRPLDALARFLHALGVRPERVPSDVDEAAALYRSLLADRRVLVLLDNAAAADQVRPLLPGGVGSLVLVTSRDHLAGLVARDGARRLTLDVLAPDEAGALLRGALGAERVRAEPAEVAELARLCGYLPLALRIAAANLSGRAGQPVADYVARLRDGDGGRLAALAVPGDPGSAVSAAFDLSYARLPGGVRRMFRRLALAPGADVTTEAAAALAGAEPEEAGRWLAALTGAHLIEEVAHGRYGCHDLLRRYAAERARREDSADDRDAAVARLYEVYLARTDGAARAAYPQVLRLRQDDCGPIREAAAFGDPVSALSWLDAERANLVAAVEHAASQHWRAWAWQLADNLRGYFYLRMHVTDWFATAAAALTSAQEADDPRAQAAAHLGLAGLRWRQDRYRDATDHGQLALAFAQRAGWDAGESPALFALGVVTARAGDLRSGVDYLRRSLMSCERVGCRPGQAAALSTLGAMCLELGEIRPAADYSRRALALNEELGSRNGQVISLVNLGTVEYLAGRLEHARDHLDRALELSRAIGNFSGSCDTQRWLAYVHLAAGHDGHAAELATSAIELAREKEHRWSEGDAHNALAAVELERGRPERAVGAYREALRVAGSGDGGADSGMDSGTDSGNDAGMPMCRVEALTGLAAAYLRLGDHDRASGNLQPAFAALAGTGYRLLEARAREVLAQLHLAEGDTDLALREGEHALAMQLETGHVLGEARVHITLGHAWHRAGDPDQARGHWRRAHTLLADAGCAQAVDVAALLATEPAPSS